VVAALLVIPVISLEAQNSGESPPPLCGQVLMCATESGLSVPGVLLLRSGGLRIGSAALVAFTCACLLIGSPPALGAGGSAQAAGSKVKGSKVCKKKRKKGTACKTHKGRRASLPALPRTVTLTWDSGADIDLKVYDMKGHHAGIQSGVIINGIPGATYSGNDSDGFGPETFSDPFGRRVGYLACYVSGPSANVTLTDSGLGGGRYTATLGPPGSPPDLTQAYTNAIGWGYLPIGAHC
jgi:hypothetical protein